MGINSTRGFHRATPIDLLNELTICESMGSLKSPYIKTFNLNKAYGELLGDFLVKMGLLGPVRLSLRWAAVMAASCTAC